MSWFLHDKAEEAIVDELEKESDRGLMIVGISYLERRLSKTIQLRMMPNIPAASYGDVFKNYGPLSTFKAKIDIGYLMQLYPRETQTLLHKLRKLRNDAAHETGAINFNENPIKQRCINLRDTSMESFSQFHHHLSALRREIDALSLPMWKGFSKLPITTSDQMTSKNRENRDDPRAIFVVSIKIVLMQFFLIREIFERIQVNYPTDASSHSLPDKSGEFPK